MHRIGTYHKGPAACDVFSTFWKACIHIRMSFMFESPDCFSRPQTRKEDNRSHTNRHLKSMIQRSRSGLEETDLIHLRLHFSSPLKMTTRSALAHIARDGNDGLSSYRLVGELSIFSMGIPANYRGDIWRVHCRRRKSRLALVSNLPSCIMLNLILRRPWRFPRRLRSPWSPSLA